MAMVRKSGSKQPLPRTQGLAADARVELEDEHIARSFAFAKAQLKL
jgi:hypothetical protein